MFADDEDCDCPLCMEEFDLSDRGFRPCPCGYQVKRHEQWQHCRAPMQKLEAIKTTTQPACFSLPFPDMQILLASY